MHVTNYFFSKQFLKLFMSFRCFLCRAGLNYGDTNVFYVFERLASLEMMITNINHNLINNLRGND